MLMTPLRTILLRIYATTLGRIAPVDRLARAIALNVRIRFRASRFVPSARFFSPEELEK